MIEAHHQNDDAIKFAFDHDDHVVNMLSEEEREHCLTVLHGKRWSGSFVGIDAPHAALQDFVHALLRRRSDDRVFTAPQLVAMTEVEQLTAE